METTTPAGACDCHIHVYDPAYPLAPSATFKPPHAPVDAYRAVQRALGLQRAIVVQPTGYGFDNRCTLDALAQFGDGARAIVVIAPDTPDAELHRLRAGLHLRMQGKKAEAKQALNRAVQIAGSEGVGKAAKKALEGL